MLSKKQKEIIQNMTFKKYKLGFFGSNPKEDWAVILILFFVLILALSVVAFFDKQNIEQKISDNNFGNVETKYFDFSKADMLIQKINGGPVVDQTPEN